MYNVTEKRLSNAVYTEIDFSHDSPPMSYEFLKYKLRAEWVKKIAQNPNEGGGENAGPRARLKTKKASTGDNEYVWK